MISYLLDANKRVALVLLITAIAIAAYSRFLNLNWDQGWGLHPDENNLWGASRRVRANTLNDPEFYAYGGFPIYLYSLLSNKVEARAVSAGAQILIVILLFVIGKRLAGLSGGFFSAAMGVFSAGLMQAGYFLTVESLLGFFGLAILFCLLKYFGSDKGKNIWLALAAIVLGLGVGTKASFAVFILPFFSLLRPGLAVDKAGPLKISKVFLRLVSSLFVAVLIFLLTNPFILTKWNDVKATFEYETKVATGNLSVFYTRQFLGTIPGWFQAVHVFPYVTGWLFLPMLLIGMFVIYFKDFFCGTAKNIFLATCISALLSFLPFWAKWTRYVVQVLPILILTAGVGASWIWEKGKFGKALAIVTVLSFLPQFFSAMNVYSNEDTRIKAAKWAEVNIPKDAKIFTEAMDLGILPFNPAHGQNIKLFNFYELDEVQVEEKQVRLDSLLEESDYFILLSRRVYKNSLDHPDKFPRTAEFYRSLFDGSAGYQKIYVSFQSKRFTAFTPEETFKVFDNPDVIIFQKRI